MKTVEKSKASFAVPEHDNKPRVIIPGVVPECVEEFAPWADGSGSDEDDGLNRFDIEGWGKELRLSWTRSDAPMESEFLQIIDFAVAGGVVRFYIDTQQHAVGATCFGVYGEDLLAFNCDDAEPQTSDQFLALLKRMAGRLAAYKEANFTLTEIEQRQQMNEGAGS